MTAESIVRALRAFTLEPRISKNIISYGGTGENPANPADRFGITPKGSASGRTTPNWIGDRRRPPLFGDAAGALPNRCRSGQNLRAACTDTARNTTFRILFSVQSMAYIHDQRIHNPMVNDVRTMSEVSARPAAYPRRLGLSCPPSSMDYSPGPRSTVARASPESFKPI
jgi:hypothetical protein